MKKIPFLFLALVQIALMTAFTRQKIHLLHTQGCSQLIVVRTPTWRSTEGKLVFYEWNGRRKVWEIKWPAVAVTVGRNGLAWGAGIQENALNPRANLKREGDGKAPAGIFTLGAAFGYAPVSANPLKVPYLITRTSTLCIDDPNSTFYNQLVDSDTVTTPDWQSFERMRLRSDAYKYGILVGYNTSNPVKGNGSCVFMHLWGNNTGPTAGCTAMTEQHMLNLLTTLDSARHPLLVQAPVSAYQQLKKQYVLPD